MPITHVAEASLPISLWPNGAGRKADIADGPGWLAAFAWLDDDAPFSDYTGIDRTITLIDGAGFELRFRSAATLAVAPLSPTGFDGGEAPKCHLPNGPCRVLNVMTRRDAWRHDVRIGAATHTAAEVTIMVALRDATRLEVDGSKALLGRWDACVIKGRRRVSSTGLVATIQILPINQ